MRQIATIIICIFLVSCSSSKKGFTSEDTSPDMLIFGEGGGFAGTVTTYKLFKNGQLFRKKPRESGYSEMNSLEEEEAEQYFNTVETMGFQNMSCNEPENWYYFLEMGDQDAKTKLIWGSNSPTATQTLKLFCKNLLNVAKKNAVVENKSVTQ